MKKIFFGLPVEIDEQTGKLTFGEEVLCQKTAAKTFAGMKHLAYDEHEAPDDHVCYVFYQNIWRKADAPLFEKTKITNGITVLMPGLMGQECHKNSGHYHSVESHCEPLPEIYEVLCGKAVFLLQQTHDFLDESKPLPVERFQAVFAGEGEKVFVPPYTAHCIVNVGDGPMAFGNMAVPSKTLYYEPIARMHGFGMYVLKLDDQLIFVPNTRYAKLPLAEVGCAVERSDLGLTFDKPLYTALMESPDTFAYLGDSNLIQK